MGAGAGALRLTGTVTTANVSTLQSQVATLQAQMANLLSLITVSGSTCTIGGTLNVSNNIASTGGNVTSVTGTVAGVFGNFGASGVSTSGSIVASGDIKTTSGSLLSLNNVYALFGTGNQITLTTHTHNVLASNPTSPPNEPS